MTDELAPDRGDGRKSHYGDGEQPWDVVVASGWGPAFAAANVVKYLRRTKNPAHSLESARWYYARLLEGVALEDDGESKLTERTPWSLAFVKLELILTKKERARVRGIV